jgi:hypothetical protein
MNWAMMLRRWRTASASWTDSAAAKKEKERKRLALGL